MLKTTLKHVFILMVLFPALLLLMSYGCGALLASLEGWAIDDGVLYVGGNLVLIPLTPVVPKTTSGRLADFFISILGLCIFAWILATVGLLPLCPGTMSMLQPKRGGRFVKSLVPPVVLIGVFFPLIIAMLPAVVAFALQVTEGWSYKDSFLRALGVLGQVPALGPPLHHRLSFGGKVLILWLAFLTLDLLLGWSVGVFLLMPCMGEIAGCLSKLTCVPRRCRKTFFGQLISFIVVVAIIVPVVFFPICLGFGAVLKHVEDWDSLDDSMLYVAGNIVLIPLTPVIPKSTAGKIVSLLIAIVSFGGFAFIIALIGALDFVDRCCGLLGGKRKGACCVVAFTFLFFFVVCPCVCAASSVPLGQLLAVVEGWDLIDGCRFAAGIMVQSPGLAPSDLRPKGFKGKVVLFLTAVYSVSVTIGWGGGMIVASSGLDYVGKWLGKVIFPAPVQESSDDGSLKELAQDKELAPDVEVVCPVKVVVEDKKPIVASRKPIPDKIALSEKFSLPPSFLSDELPQEPNTSLTLRVRVDTFAL